MTRPFAHLPVSLMPYRDSWPDSARSHVHLVAVIADQGWWWGTGSSSPVRLSGIVFLGEQLPYKSRAVVSSVHRVWATRRDRPSVKYSGTGLRIRG